MTIQLIHGDCLDVDWPQVDAVITDPPWNMDFFEDDKKTWENYANWLDKVRIKAEQSARYGVFIFQSTKAVPYTAHLFKDYMPFAAVKNFSQMTKKKLPNCWDIAFYKVESGYLANGRNWFLCNTAGMLKERTGHPTPRSLDVMEYIISMFSWQTILDPFVGSGTTGIACQKAGRNFIGIEKDEKYYNIAKERLGL